MPSETKGSSAVEALLKEKRKFAPPKEFGKRAAVNRPAVYRDAAKNPARFWERFARELDWFKPWKTTLVWKAPYAKWFVGGKLNVSYNCLDRHVATARKTKAAIIWEGEPGDARVLTYWDLYREVNRFAAALKRRGVKKGDRVTIYMPMVPELPIAMLACARIGAPHSVVFGGFAPEALRDRIHDAESRILITSDGGFRRGGTVALKKNADDALRECPDVHTVVVLKRTRQEITMQAGRDVWWDDFVKDAPAYCAPEKMDAEDMLYLLYTSGSTGKPKGIVHTTGGYLTGVYATTKWVFDLRDTDVYWCTADIGWVTGHSYIVYGPLANGTTTVMYEGTPDYPDKDRFWRIVEKYGVTICYTAPTAIRTFMRWGEEFPKRCDLSSLRLLGSVGEPINPEAWVWYWKVIGGGRCPVVDTWWQTETGHIMITPLPGVTTLKPGSATRPFPGVEAEVVNDKGEPAKAGYLVLKKPWPGDAARHLPRSTAVRGPVLEQVPRHLLHRRRGQGGRGRLLLAAGTRGRRHEHLRSPGVHDGSGVGAGRPPARGRGRRHRPPARDQGPGDRRLRHHQGRHRAQQGADRGAEGPRGQEDRSPRTARRPHLHLRPAQDPLAERSCAACSATSPRARCWGIPRPWRIRAWWPRSRRSTAKTSSGRGDCRPDGTVSLPMDLGFIARFPLSDP